MALNCDNIAVGFLELLNSYLATTGGEVGIRVKIITADAEDISDYIACDPGTTNLSENLIARVTTGLTDSGKPCLVLIQETP